MSHGLGRLYAPDERDGRYPLARQLPTRPQLDDQQQAAVDRGWRYWNPSGWWGDQGDTPQCVVFAWGHYVEDGPVTFAGTRHASDTPPFDMDDAYRWCQDHDEWEGNAYDGTSVRAGARLLVARGHAASYVWAADTDEVVRTLLTVGPVVVGTWWYEGMDDPDGDGWLTVDGARRGGHAYLLNGVNRREGKVRVKNSWGRGWGDGGHAWLRLADLDRLLFAEQGEACLAVEAHVTPV